MTNALFCEVCFYKTHIFAKYVDHTVAVSITGCTDSLADGASVLKHSIHLQSYPQSKQSKYTYKMIAFVHPEAKGCIEPLKKLDYEIMIKETPINVADIEGDFLRKKVSKTGCCGDKEFLKLYAYTLVDYDVVVHLDLDTLIIQSLDDLFDSMRLTGSAKAESDRRIAVMNNDPIPDKVEAFFTRDYNMAVVGKKHVNVQGGFIIVKPNLDYFEEYKRAILKGNFKPSAGWEGKYGGFFGGQQIQGLCAYFFDGLHPGTAVELNRCVYNQMNDAPRKNKGPKSDVQLCVDGTTDCEDCRKQDFALVKSVHFTLCQKPWVCPIYIVKNTQSLCMQFHKKWFEIREDMEKQLGIYSVTNDNDGDFHNDVFRGYCKGGGQKGYQKVAIDQII